MKFREAGDRKFKRLIKLCSAIDQKDGMGISSDYRQRIVRPECNMILRFSAKSFDTYQSESELCETLINELKALCAKKDVELSMYFIDNLRN